MSDRRLLFSITIKDCDVETFKSSGPGGQHKNKTRSAVRITHRASGAVGACSEHRSQHQNKKEAFCRMGESKIFQAWARAEAARRRGEKTVGEQVEETMVPSNIRTEVRSETGTWQVVDPKELRE